MTSASRIIFSRDIPQANTEVSDLTKMAHRRKPAKSYAKAGVLDSLHILSSAKESADQDLLWTFHQLFLHLRFLLYKYTLMNSELLHTKRRPPFVTEQ
jgi:hypothetical protein